MSATSCIGPEMFRKSLSVLKSCLENLEEDGQEDGDEDHEGDEGVLGVLQVEVDKEACAHRLVLGLVVAGEGGRVGDHLNEMNHSESKMAE